MRISMIDLNLLQVAGDIIPATFFMSVARTPVNSVVGGSINPIFMLTNKHDRI